MCGVFGIHGHDEAANIAYLGMHALQHRGQESAGLVAADDGKLRRHVAMGLVSDAFNRDVLAKLPGSTAIGHVRYSTAGSSELRNAQPFLFEYAGGSVAIAHNGNLVNASELRAELEASGSLFQTSSDTEVIVHLMAKAREPDVLGKLQSALKRLRGAYSLIILTTEGTSSKMIGVRDPNGFRPLVLGRLKDAYVLSSETCSFDLIEADLLREIEPGEIVVIEKGGMTTHRMPESTVVDRTFCVFEHVYFARPDSLVNGKSVYRAREKMGMKLALEAPVEADVVIPVPDSGVPAAIGYSKQSGIPFEMGLIRSHYVGRTFIEPQDSIRHFGVRLKLSPVRSIVDGKRVVVVDDSLVRGTTSRKIVKMLRAAGAKEVHLRISAPPTTHPCYYGIDTPTRSELVAASHSVDEINRYVTSDSLSYLSHEGMMQAVGSETGKGYCSACFTGKYPVALGQGADLVTLRRAKV
ncbi:MAG TPA: amidophosphoribosyltransferase [Kofleriaceae bacterium]|nr:amidophosphoribosyltransferase [Kofleriaceae bacterium]